MGFYSFELIVHYPVWLMFSVISGLLIVNLLFNALLEDTFIAFLMLRNLCSIAMFVAIQESTVF